MCLTVVVIVSRVLNESLTLLALQVYCFMRVQHFTLGDFYRGTVWYRLYVCIKSQSTIVSLNRPSVIVAEFSSVWRGDFVVESSVGERLSIGSTQLA